MDNPQVIERITRLEEKVRYLEESYRRIEKKIDHIYYIALSTLFSMLGVIILELALLGVR